MAGRGNRVCLEKVVTLLPAGGLAALALFPSIPLGFPGIDTLPFAPILWEGCR